MPWVKFYRDFTWNPPEKNGRVSIRFEAGKTYSNIRKQCAEEAVAKLYGEYVEREPGQMAPKGRARKKA